MMYELIDCGDERRLERFGSMILDRPAPQAYHPKRLEDDMWQTAHAYYDRSDPKNSGWLDLSVFPTDWQMQIDDLTFELRPSINNQVGIFPEQLANWQWLRSRLKNNPRPTKVLNAFAYTGAASLMASAAGPHVEVCHLDASKASVTWAKRNAELSHLPHAKIRWIVDDVLKFLQREIKRGQKYDAFILDPPAFGRSAGVLWKLERDLPILLECVNELLSDKPSFVILSCHAPEFTAAQLAEQLEELDAFRGRRAEALDLTLPSTHGNSLPSSICGRIHF